MNQNAETAVLLTKEEINEGMKAHEGLVRTMAARLAGAWDKEADDDLLQAGRIGLWEGLRRYDKSRGVRQTTYAGFWVRRGILRELESRRKYADLFPASLQDPAGDEGEATLADLHADALVADPGDEAEREEMQEAVLQRLAALRPVDRETVELHYGLRDGIPRTLREIAAKRGVSTARVHKVLHLALAALRPPAPAA